MQPYDLIEPTPVLRDGALYLGDNGRCFCGAHAGCSARYTGYDISGQRVMRVTPAVARAWGEDAALLRCEQPGCGRKVTA